MFAMRRAVLVLLLLGVTIAYAQRYRGNRYRPAAPPAGVEDLTWEVDPKFKRDVFTFVRIRYHSTWRDMWDTDYPDSDQNFSFRLQQLTSLKVNPEPIILELTDKELFQYHYLRENYAL